MTQNNCPQCGAPIAYGALECKYCGESIKPAVIEQANIQQSNYQQHGYQSQANQPPIYQQQAYNQQFRPPHQQPVYPAQIPPSPVLPPPVPPVKKTLSAGVNPAWPIKSKVVAGVLAIFLGSFGIHKFYLGKTGMGILYLLFCWTYIPGIIGFIEGIIYLASNDHNFQVKNRVRLY